MDEYESLQGAGRDTTTITSPAREILSCTDNNSVSGFTFRTTEDLGDVIGVSCRNASPSFYDNRIDGNHNQLSLGLLVSGESSDNAQFYDNEIVRCGFGAQIKDSRPEIIRNLLANSRYGFLFANPELTVQDIHKDYLKTNELRNVANRSVNLE